MNLQLGLNVERNAFQAEEILETKNYRPSELEESSETDHLV